MKVVIFAGGMGTRISEESHLKPKPMIEIGGKPILWHIMKLYQSYGHNEFIICLGYKGHMIREYFMNYFLCHSDVTVDLKSNKMEVHNSMSEDFKITLIDTGLNTMTAGRLKRVQKYVDQEDFMLTYGDGVSDININALVDCHKKHGKTATMTAVQPSSRFGVMEFGDDNTITKFNEKPKESGSWINGGFFVFNKEMLKVFRELAQTESFWYALNKRNIDRELVKIVDGHKEEADSEFLKRLAYFMAYVSDHITPFFENYSVFIKNIAVAIGYKMSLNKDDLELSALFSHSGYIFIPTNLLNSSDRLDESDFNIIKAHPYYTKLLLDTLGVGDNIKYPAVYHHEKKSKDGYPFKVTVVDEYTEVLRISTFLAALLQDRPYRVSYEYEEAKNILNSEEFDKRILDIALELELENVVKTQDEYYEGIGRLFL